MLAKMLPEVNQKMISLFSTDNLQGLIKIRRLVNLFFLDNSFWLDPRPYNNNLYAFFCHLVFIFIFFNFLPGLACHPIGILLADFCENGQQIAFDEVDGWEGTSGENSTGKVEGSYEKVVGSDFQLIRKDER